MALKAAPRSQPPAEANDFRRAGFSLRTFKEGSVKSFTYLCALVSILTTLGIVLVLITQAFPFFKEVSPVAFLTGKEWKPASNLYGVLPLVTGTLAITLGAGLIAIPLGLLSAIFLSEYAPKRVRQVLKPALELLAGIPTVVYGYLGLTLVTPWLRKIDGTFQAQNWACGAIVVGIMILPLVSSLCEDAISAVPKPLREGAYGLGSTKMEVILKIVVPAALSGIMASFILALSRALGETMAVTLAAGQTPFLTADPRKSVETMTAFIVTTAQGDIPQGTTRTYAIFAVAMTLFVFTMVLNLIALRLVRRFRQVYS